MNYKQKRKAIVKEIGNLHDNHCDVCPKFNAQNSVACSGCEIKDKLIHLGDTLMFITKEQRALKTV